MTYERYKQIMEQLGMPESRSLMQALYQVANETEQEVRKKLTSDIDDYAKCKNCQSNGNIDGRCDMCCNNKPDMYEHFV